MQLELVKYIHVGDYVYHNEAWKRVAKKYMTSGIVVYFEGFLTPVRYKPRDIVRISNGMVGEPDNRGGNRDLIKFT